MASSLYLIVVLCLTSGLWIGSNASESDYCYYPCKTCPSGWTQFEDHCYQFHRAPLAWADAEAVCLGLGGNLASVPNAATYDFIKQSINRVTNNDERTWVGGHDTAKEGFWQWSDGTKFDFNDWGSGQPDNAGDDEHCIELNFDVYDLIKQSINRGTNNDERTWVGGHDTAKEGVWLWTDGAMFDFKSWGSGQPDNTGNNEHCLELNYNGMH